MGKKIRDRRDQYYRLARESGYRSRAAFKLLQLDSKIGFLSTARCVVDLCAAPGGWLQAAQERMPGGSMIIGVDLVPIRPIQGVTTLQGDITTQECKTAILREMTGWLADIVLHDGSPNVGGNWPREAFDQNCLVLSAVKLASTILRKGGTFVTKIFRSQDYTALLGLFRKLFSKVQATKPAASRSESAEIFVVCQNFQPIKGEEAIGLFDQAKVFAATSAVTGSNMLPVKSGEAAAAAVLRERKRLHRTREGYSEEAAGGVAYGALSALKFVECNDGMHAKMIADNGSIVLDDPRLADHPLTTSEIRECCRDIRVLGRRELRLLLAWRRKMNRILTRKEKKKDAPETTPVDKEEIDEDEEEMRRTEQQIKALKEAEDRRTKKRLKKSRESKLAARKRMTAAPEAAKFKSVHDLLLEEEGGQNELFSIKQLRSAADMDAALDDQEAAQLASSEEEEGDDEYGLKPRRKTVAYKVDEERDYDDAELERRKPATDDDSKKKKKKGKKDKKGKSGDMNEMDPDSEELSEAESVGQCPLEVEVEPTSERDRRCIQQWESAVSSLIASDVRSKDSRKRKEPSSGDDSSDEEDDAVIDDELADWELEAMARIKGKDKSVQNNPVQKSKKPKKSVKDELDSDVDDDDDIDTSDEESGDEQQRSKKSKSTVPDPVTLALGAKMVSSRKNRRELIESGYNRNAFGPSEDLPSWFVQDEKTHRQPNLPVTKEEVALYKDRLKALDVRPIHKVAEARGRKKRRMMGKIEAARKEAEKLADNDQMTDAEKQAALKRVYRSARSATRKDNRVQLVMSRGRATGKRTMRPPGVKGRYKVVDSRMKKDLRAQKNAAKRKGGKGKGRR